MHSVDSQTGWRHLWRSELHCLQARGALLTVVSFTRFSPPMFLDAELRPFVCTSHSSYFPLPLRHFVREHDLVILGKKGLETKPAVVQGIPC